MNSRTAGAPSTPIATEEEMTLEALKADLASGVLTKDQYDQAVSTMTRRVASEGMRLGEFPDDPGPAAMAASRLPESVSRVAPEVGRARRRADGDEGPPVYSGFVGGTAPATEYELQELRYRAHMDRRVAEAEAAANARAYGTPYGGGSAFQSEGDVAEYHRRNLLSEDERADMVARGMTPQQIVDAQRSQADRDLAKAGFSGGSGSVPVYTADGGVTYMERAYTDGAIGQTNVAEGPRRTGPRVESGELSDSLERPDLENKGYTKVQRSGPYGMETVWQRTGLGDETRGRLRRENRLMVNEPGGAAREITYEEYLRQQQENRQRRRLLDAAGISSTQAQGQSLQQLRDLIADNRAAAKRDQAEVNRRARMAAPYRRELAFSEMPEDWRNAVAAETLAPGLEGVTPIQRDAQSMQNLLRMMNMEALAGADPLNRDLRQRQMEEAERESNPTAAGQRDLRSGEFFSPQAAAAVNAMAAMFDEDRGGFSEQSERRLAKYLQDNYNVPQPDAERLANVAANGRRRWWMQQAPAAAEAPERPVPSVPVPRGSFRD